MRTLRITLINLTGVSLTSFLIILVSYAMSVNNSMTMVLPEFFGIVAIICLFFANLQRALTAPKQRKLYVVMMLWILVTLFIFIPLSKALHLYTQERWFFKKGMHEYELLVKTILISKARLTDKESDLSEIIDRKFTFGMTNADGSLTVWFHGRGNYSRAGYLYHSGSQLIVNPKDTNTFFFQDNPNSYYYHLTNGWYEF